MASSSIPPASWGRGSPSRPSTRASRVRFRGRLGNAQLTLQVDVGFGDAVVPGPVEAEYPTILDSAAARSGRTRAKASSRRSSTTMVLRGLLNSRLRDYFDVWALSRQFDFEGPLLACRDGDVRAASGRGALRVAVADGRVRGRSRAEGAVAGLPASEPIGGRAAGPAGGGPGGRSLPRPGRRGAARGRRVPAAVAGSGAVVTSVSRAGEQRTFRTRAGRGKPFDSARSVPRSWPSALLRVTTIDCFVSSTRQPGRCGAGRRGRRGPGEATGGAWRRGPRTNRSTESGDLLAAHARSRERSSAPTAQHPAVVAAGGQADRDP